MDEFFEDDINQYLPHYQYQESEVRKPSFELGKSNDNNQTHKTKNHSEVQRVSFKNKYIRLLEEYVNNHDSQHLKFEESYSIASMDKKERNRMAAKQSRDRKKLYVQLMEYEQKRLETQINQINKEIEQTKEKLNKFCSENKTILGLYTRCQLENRLQQILESQHTASTDEEIAIVIDSLLFRVGATGRQRMQKQNQCYKQIVNLSLPALHRYLLWTSTESKHIFSLNKNLAVDQAQIKYSLPIEIENMESKEEKLNEIKLEIASKKPGFIDLIAKLWAVKMDIQNVTKHIEGQIHGVRDTLTAVQAAKFTLFTKHYGYRKQLNFLEKFVQEKHHVESLPRKKVKRQK